MIYVTHDQVEAMTMADKIVVLNAGRIEQVGSPLELYRAPRNVFVAGFIGSPKMNLMPGAALGESVATVGVRPEHLHVSREGGPAKGGVMGVVTVSEHLGSDTFLHVKTDHGLMTVRVGGDVPVSHGDSVTLTPEAAQIHRFDTEGQRI
jgi:multiple sugar transport system ATP-binding protein